MGVNNPKDFSYAASADTTSSLVLTQNENYHQPMVDIDANNVLHSNTFSLERLVLYMELFSLLIS
jgi:hypothetical protein